MTTEQHYDVCIVGAGPAALACLSAIREPYSIDHLSDPQVKRALHSLKHHQQLSVCVIDPHPEWMHEWKTVFSQLRIEHLRSPAMAHPDMFDSNALLTYACFRKRDKTELYESGCFEIKELLGLGQTQVGLWKLPSTALFLDFCRDLVNRLPHKRIKGQVVNVHQDSNSKMYQVEWSSNGDTSSPFAATDSNNNFVVSAHNVILATGMVGRPLVPSGLGACPALLSWKDPDAFPEPTTTMMKSRRPCCPATSSNKSKKSSSDHTSNAAAPEHILVVGGGLTAVQTALRVVQDGHSCVLCSRRPLQEKHFDIPVQWFDPRHTNQHLSSIYHDTPEGRMAQLKEARDGGSVPPMYMKRLSENSKKITCWVGEVEYLAPEEEEAADAAGEDETPPQNDDSSSSSPSSSSSSSTRIMFQGSVHTFDRVILACGIIPDCSVHPVVSKLLEKWPIPVHGGLPLVTEDLQWDGARHPNLFVTGGLSALQVGPDAGNLMGIRRGAMVVANTLECRCWLRQKVLLNPFEALFLHDESDTETEAGSIVDCPCGCCSDEED